MNEMQQVRREGFAYALTLDLYPHLRKKDPAGFDRDVQALYEYMLQPARQGGDPLHLSFYPGDPHYRKNALARAEAWITGPRDHPTTLSQELGAGNAEAAANTLGFNYTKHSLPVPMHGGYPVGGHMPSTWQTVVGTVKDIPKGAEHLGSDVGHGVGAVTGGIGGWFGKHLLVVVLVVVLVLIVKK